MLVFILLLLFCGESTHQEQYDQDGAAFLNGLEVDNPHIFNNNNYVNLGAGEDTLHGGNDVDTLYGGHGEDILTGGHGSDLFIIELGDRYSTSETDFMTAICPGEDERLTIVTELVEQAVTDQWGILTTFTITQITNVSSLIDSSTNKFYSDVILSLEIELTNVEYYPTTFEYTKDNNTRGIMGVIPPPMGGWKTGVVNYVSFLIPDDWYRDAENTPWSNMTRLQLYANGRDFNVPNETITFRNVRFGRTSGNCGIDDAATPKGLSSSDTLIDVFNAGKIALNASGGEMIAVVDRIEERACEQLTAEYNQELQDRIAELTARIDSLEVKLSYTSSSLQTAQDNMADMNSVVGELRSVVMAELEGMRSSPPGCTHS